MNTIDRDGLPLSADAVYRAAFQAHPAIAVVTDERAVVTDANRTAVAFFNVVRGAIVGKPLIFFVARRDTRFFREHVRNMAREAAGSLVVQLRPRGGTPRTMRLTIERANGALLWLAIPEEGDARDGATSHWQRSRDSGMAGSCASGSPEQLPLQ
jgi:PAS domain-containing protein